MTKELQAQAATARDDAKATIDRHLAEIRTDYNERVEKLKRAWEPAKAALAR